MDRLLYISFLNEDVRLGYKNKIHSQAKALSENGLCVRLIICSNYGMNLYGFQNGNEKYIKTIEFKHKRVSKKRNSLDEFFNFYQFCAFIEHYIEKYSFKYTYIRRIYPSIPRLISMLSRIRKKVDTVIYEYPSFPWEDEYKLLPKKTLRSRVFYGIDKIMYNKILERVDFVTYIGSYDGNDKKFFQIQNAGDPKYYPLAHCRKTNDSLNLIGLAHVTYWTGFDLVIDSLSKYYKSNPSKKVYFNIVGTVDPSLHLEEKVKSLQLSEYVRFLGYKTGKELDEIFDNSDIGVNALRIDPAVRHFDSATTLKTVEYCFRGLPQIARLPINIDRNKTDSPSFIFICNNNWFSIDDIIDFYNKCSITPQKIREYAIRHLTWKESFTQLMGYINEKES